MLKRIFFLVILLPSLLVAQRTIKGVFSPAKDYKYALLYKVTPTVSVFVRNAEVQEDGSFMIQLDSTVTKGMYRLVYAVPQEDHNFDIIYNAKEDIALSFNSETGVEFQKSIENRLLDSYTSSMSMVTQRIGDFYRQEVKDSLGLAKTFKIQKDTQNSFEKAAKGTMALHFIRANKPYIPQGFENANSYIGNLEAHYFDAIDFNNETLLSSNFIIEKMFNYIFGVSAEDDEDANYKKNIDVFWSKIKNNTAEIKKSFLVEIWQQMTDLNNESVANYISETYLMNLAVALNDQELLNALLLYKNISIGSVAPDFSWETLIDKKKITNKLSELNAAENYIVVFWSSTCSHCLDEIPQLQTFVKNQEKGKLKVIAIGLESEPYKWKDLTYSYPTFIHVYGKGKWDNKIGHDYGVTGTPTYFVLDSDKRIIAKPENFEALKSWFEQE